MMAGIPLNSDNCCSCSILHSKINIFHLINEHFIGKKKCTEKKYLIIKYGPSDSWKNDFLYDIQKNKANNDLKNVNKNNTIDININNIIKKILYQSNFFYKKQFDYQKIYNICRPFANKISHLLFRQTLINSKFNIEYEMTGNDISSLINVINRAKKKKYNIILAYPMTSKEKLLERVKLKSLKRN